MVRLPTRQSDGKANLHQGAVGAGIAIATGITLPAVGAGNAIVDEHPDTGAPIAGRLIPHWDRILLMAAQCYELTGLGYLGADIVLDAEFGPLMLELNARPGLNVQIANQDGLRRRIKRVDPLAEQARIPGGTRRARAGTGRAELRGRRRLISSPFPGHRPWSSGVPWRPAPAANRAAPARASLRSTSESRLEFRLQRRHLVCQHGVMRGVPVAAQAGLGQGGQFLRERHRGLEGGARLDQPVA
jgi:hypothetical protein